MEDEVCKPQFSNWVKAGLALKLGKAAIQPLVLHGVTEFRDAVLDISPLKYCNQCTYTNVTPCRTKGFCYGPRNNCTTHDASDPSKISTPCPNGVCGKLCEAIRNSHFIKPIWANSDARKWCDNPFEIAKCYMSVGYADTLTLDDTDFTGVLDVVINAKFMKNVLFDPESLVFKQVG